MKNFFHLCLTIALLSFGGAACKNPLAKFTPQYRCTIAGEPEPKTSEDFVKRGTKHLENNNYSAAFDECAFGAASEAVRLDPNNADAYALRGYMYRAKKEYDAALADLSEAIRLAPDNSNFYSVRSTVYEDLGLFENAVEDLSLPVRANGSHHDYARRGQLYFKLENYENALKDYTEAIRLKPEYSDHYTVRAEIYRKLGKFDLAEADELKVLELDNAEREPPSGPALGKSTSSSKTISGGVLNERATALPKPAYPAAARAVRASGAVNVQVTIDENGNVISASAVSGHPLLRASAVQAARSSKFSPTKLSGQPVKVTGVIVYNFVP
jgi:TonB family protein